MKIVFYLGVAFLSLLFSGCTPSPSKACPKDQELLDKFVANEAAFEKLLAEDGQTKDALASLGVETVRNASEKPKRVIIRMWYQDFFGPGGCLKGYAYCEQAPLKTVTDIDANSNPGSPEEKELYRPIKGNWYLYYWSAN